MATRWYNHFLKVLNNASEYRDDVINNKPLLAPILELSQALSKLKKRKAGGKYTSRVNPLWKFRIVEQNIEVDAKGMGRRESSGRVAGCSSCPSSKERGSQTL